MASYIAKDKNVILRQALSKLQRTTSITAIGPGSVARTLTEIITTELGDFYSILDFNMAMSVVSTAQGRALDLLGELYNVKRKSLTEIATIAKESASFYFYLDQPIGLPIVIPQGTSIYTNTSGFIGDQYTYTLIEGVTIPAGRTRVYADIRPSLNDSVFTSGINTLTRHNFIANNGTIVRCTNPKPISPQVGFEGDSDYRIRIIKAVRTTAGGTADAIRFKALGIQGVRDIKVRVAPYGLGSFEVLVVSEDLNNQDFVVNNVLNEILKITPVGTKLYIRTPEIMPIDMEITVSTRALSNEVKSAITRRAYTFVLVYINELTVGQTFIYNQLIQRILDSNDDIIDMNVTSLRVNGNQILHRNFAPEEDQQIVPGNIKISYS